MEIQLGFHHDELRQRIQRGAPLVFEIAWEHDGVVYPAPHWTDFGAVIMVWWLRVVVELFEGTDTSEFLFMDGPYALEARYQPATGLVELAPRGRNWVWRIPLSIVARELVRAANTVSEELLSAGVGEADRQSVEYGVTRVRSTVLANA
jgi:hypothetical protein